MIWRHVLEMVEKMTTPSRTLQDIGRRLASQVVLPARCGDDPAPVCGAPPWPEGYTAADVRPALVSDTISPFASLSRRQRAIPGGGGGFTRGHGMPLQDLE